MKKTCLIISILVCIGFSHSIFARTNYQKPNRNCQLPDKEDSYKLAVNWQPAFCESHRKKPECKITDRTAYQAGHFTLHGLWPNKHECGTNYGLCGKYKQPVKSFCDYQAITLTESTQNALADIMPSFASGSCLERHEWYKHGTCQTTWNADQYFATAIRLVKEFNDQGIADFMQKHTGKTVETEEFLHVVDKVFGKNASQRLNLACDQNGLLIDVFINLPKDIAENTSLATLIQQAPTHFNNRCGQRFTIDAIGFN